MTLSKKKLWEAQVREYPRSKRLSLDEVYKWCDAAPDMYGQLRRYAQISLALQYGNAVFYLIEGTKYRGFRFGLQGHQYASLYGE